MKKITLKALLICTVMALFSCSNEEKTPIIPEASDPRLPNQSDFKPAIQLIPKTIASKSTGKTFRITAPSILI